LLEEARSLLGSSNRFAASVEELRRGRTASLRIGLPPGLPQAVWPDLLASLREKDPGAQVEVRELTTPDQLDALHEGSLDLGVVREPVDDTRLPRRTLLVEPLGVSLPAGHPLANRPTLTLRELQDELFVCFPRPLGAGAARRPGSCACARRASRRASRTPPT
jgi:DNA-binding transcriptional LysR family regulator